MIITGTTKTIGVWGHPVSHSRSPAMQNAALEALGLDIVYAPFDVAPEDLPSAVAGLRAMGIRGTNVTVPHKEPILPLLDVVSEEALRVGSVNTVDNRDGVLYGHTTDGAGFLRSLERCGEKTENRRAVILGAGGSACAVAFAIAGSGGSVQISNRTSERAERLAERINCAYAGSATVIGWGARAEKFDLLVNTTALGMHPQEDSMPELPPGALRPEVFVCDLVYSPPETRLLAAARRAGCRAINGLPMLVMQGALALSIWTSIGWESLPLGKMFAAIGCPE